MAKKNQRNTKGRIVAAAWQLFYQQGYEDTTVDEIVGASQTSKGSFYHYFNSKDALLGSLAYLLDDRYAELAETFTPEMTAYDKLIYLNQSLFSMIESTVSIDLMVQLMSSQLTVRGEKHLLDHSRYYYRLLRQLITQGQQSGDLNPNRTVTELVKLYALCERALLYDWCICGGSYSLHQYAQTVFPGMIADMRKE